MNSKYLYLTINLCSIAIPLLASFYPKAPFFKQWKYLAPAILIPGILFLIWDEYFTRIGIWGFNPTYLTGLYIGSLPIEEVLFFICIPYACVFTYFALDHLTNKDILKPYEVLVTGILILALLVSGIFHLDKAYTGTTFILLAMFLSVEWLKNKAQYMSRFYFTFMIILVPFFIVNGILTGSFIEGEVVWYNNEENLGIRLGTIPLEDVFYGMLLLMMNVSLFEIFKRRGEDRTYKKKRATAVKP